VNENDATATDEITFGDNDSLAAQVAVLTRARLLVLLTEVDGVYSRAPGTPGAELLDDGSLSSAVGLGRVTGLGRGGMGSKIAAAQLAAGAGIPTVIASGRAGTVLVPIVAGERRGTRFEGDAAAGEPAFKLWIRYGKQVRGSVVLDAGAERALRAAGASVLAVGVTGCDGGFGPGDAIELVSASGVPIGKGIASIAAAEVGSRERGLEVVHRDRLVLY